jgi:hypothetical protein
MQILPKASFRPPLVEIVQDLSPLQSYTLVQITDVSERSTKMYPLFETEIRILP